MTVMNRLVAKGVLSRRVERRSYVYEATATDAAGIALAGRSLARQIHASRRLAHRIRELARPLPDQLTEMAAQAQLETGGEPPLQALSAVRTAISLLGATMFAAVFLASVSGFGGPSAVHHATGAGLATTTLLASLACAAPFASAGLLAYMAVARRARRPLRHPAPVAARS
jgi:hypothetical protein